jgi:hypothetical protein
MDYGKGQKVVIYTHWGGSNMASDLAEALARGQSRWDDVTYLARVIVSGFCGGAGINEVTGIGIAPYDMDTQQEDIMLDLVKRRVEIGDSTWSYQEFINLELN